VISLRIDRRGRVEDVQLSESSGFDLLDREALRAVRLWRFSREDAGRESVHRIVFRLD
jgi:periplasmic protein TonB